MRYIRFLKTPRIVAAKNAQKQHVACLITITSDLGESFLPHDVQLSAQLLRCTPVEEQVLVWATVQWTSGMRSLPIVIPLPKHHAFSSSPLRLRVGTEPKNAYDDYSALAEEDARGVVSASSPAFALNKEAPKLAERRFKLSDGSTLCIWEETGESIARHLWDAGITLSCKIPDLAHLDTPLSKALSPFHAGSSMTILELGTGCGIVGIALAQTIPNATVLLTDLPEAREIVQRNIDQSSPAPGASLTFLQLDWDAELPNQVHKASSPISLVIAADCTYNSDSSPALVNTLSRLANPNPDMVVAVAMKMRHSSEQIFFRLMEDAGFIETAKLDFPLPGDVKAGEEVVYLHVYRSSTTRRWVGLYPDIALR